MAASSKRKKANGEGSIYQRKDGRWVAQIFAPECNGRARRKYIYGRTRKEVAQRLTTTQHNLQQGIAPVPERLTVAQWLTRWLDVAIKPPARRPNTYISYEVRIRRDLIPGLGHHRLAQLQPHHVETWLRAQQDGSRAARTIRLAHEVLRAALEHALRQGLVHRNVAKLVEGVRVERVEPEPLEPSVINDLLAAVRGDTLEALYVLALATGLRRGELLGLHWEDVDLEKSELRVRTQAQHGAITDLKRVTGRRIVPLAPMAVEALQRHRVAQLERRLQAGAAWEDQGLVFPSRFGRPLDPTSLWWHTCSLLKKAGIPRHRMHIYRHTFASLHLAAGADLHEVSKLLGHSSIRVTADVYGHLTRQVRAAAAMRIEAALRQAQ